MAVRAPLQIGIMFHGAPLELYGEVALKLALLDANDNNDDVDLDGGSKIRVAVKSPGFGPSKTAWAACKRRVRFPV